MEYYVSFKTAGRGTPKYVHLMLGSITIQNQSHKVKVMCITPHLVF